MRGYPDTRFAPRKRGPNHGVSAFTSAKIDKILELRPDLVLAFSDLQADIVRELIQKGLTVLAFNQRSVTEILQMILTLAGLVGVPQKGRALASELSNGLEEIRASTRRFSSTTASVLRGVERPFD